MDAGALLTGLGLAPFDGEGIGEGEGELGTRIASPSGETLRLLVLVMLPLLVSLGEAVTDAAGVPEVDMEGGGVRVAEGGTGDPDAEGETCAGDCVGVSLTVGVGVLVWLGSFGSAPIAIFKTRAQGEPCT